MRYRTTFEIDGVLAKGRLVSVHRRIDRCDGCKVFVGARIQGPKTWWSLRHETSDGRLTTHLCLSCGKERKARSGSK